MQESTINRTSQLEKQYFSCRKLFELEVFELCHYRYIGLRVTISVCWNCRVCRNTKRWKRASSVNWNTFPPMNIWRSTRRPASTSTVDGISSKACSLKWRCVLSDLLILRKPFPVSLTCQWRTRFRSSKVSECVYVDHCSSTKAGFSLRCKMFFLLKFNDRGFSSAA